MIRRFAVLLFPLLLLACETQPSRITVVFSGGATGNDLDFTVAGTQRFMERHPEIRVVVVPTPRNNSERLEYYRQLAERRSDEVDVLQIDVVWIGMLADHALDLRQHIAPERIVRHFPSNVENNTVDGRLVAMPWFADAPILFYRRDLLAKYGYEGPPETWDELAGMAGRIQDGERRAGNLGFWGYLWQGRAYEGLTCNALEWQHSYGGGNFVEGEGGPNLDREEVARAFNMARGWVGTISPPQVVGFDEEDSRLIWQKGDTAFLRNWSYVYSLTQATAIGKDFAVAPLPAGPGGRSGTLGGWQLMVSKYSRNPRAAAALVDYLTGNAEQKIRAIEGSYNPTIASLYADREVLEAVPFFDGFEEAYRNLVVRPTSVAGHKYDDVSVAYSRAVNDVISGRRPAAERLREAEREIDEILAQ
jgi:trehalose/maltose transport system substrate-binding protein